MKGHLVFRGPVFRGTVFWVLFLGVVLGVRFLRPLGGQKPPPLKTESPPKKLPLYKNYDMFTIPFSIVEQVYIFTALKSVGLKAVKALKTMIRWQMLQYMSPVSLPFNQTSIER